MISNSPCRTCLPGLWFTNRGSQSGGIDYLLSLQRRPWEATVEDADPKNLVFGKLSIVMILRYLNTRILLHRPILSASFHDICQAQDFPPDSEGPMSPQSKQRLFSPELAELSINI
ncbi:hypothetical protein V8C40DRAFT_258493 [Trichoderma camerunense]